MSHNGGYDRYRAALADENAWARSRRPKCCKLASSPRLRQAVAGKLRLNWSPEQIELSPNFGDGLAGQAAAVVGSRSVGLAMTSIPSLNVTPRTSFGNWLWPSRRRQLFCAASSSLKTIASAVLLDRQPFDRIVRWRTVAKVLSMGLVVRRCFQCSAWKP